MAVLLVGTGGLFTRLGRIGKVAHLLNQHQAALPAAFDAIVAQYQSALQGVGGSVAQQQLSLIRSGSSFMGFAAAAAQQTLVQMMEADTPAQARSIPDAMAELIRQMKAAAQTVLNATVAIAPAALAGSVGTGVLVTTNKRGDGLVQENSGAETLRLVVSADSYSGGQTAGRESFRLGGESPLAGTWDWDYPQGSGASVSSSAVSADQDGTSSGNLTTNGDFETWSGSPLAISNFTLAVGTWGTHAVQSATFFRGAFSLQLVAGATLTAFYQEFNLAAGTSAALTPLTSYAVNLWCRKEAGTITGGVITVELVDSAGTVINDDQAVANSFTIDCTTLTTSFVAKNGVFRIPKAPPAIMRVRVRISTALAGGNVLIDDLCVSGMTAFYAGGPAYTVFSGATAFVIGDGWAVPVTNTRPTYLAGFQALFDRLFGMRQLGQLLPSSGAPTIADTLITA